MQGGASTVVTTRVGNRGRNLLGIRVTHTGRPTVLRPLLDSSYSTGRTPVLLTGSVAGEAEFDVHKLVVDGTPRRVAQLRHVAPSSATRHGFASGVVQASAPWPS